MNTYRTYRVEWVFEVRETNQYGQVCFGYETFYSSTWSNRELALADQEKQTRPHKFVKDRLVYKDAKHEYHECRIRQVETLISEETK